MHHSHRTCPINTELLVLSFLLFAHLNQKEKCEHLPDAVCIVSVSAVRPYDSVKDNAFTALPFIAPNFSLSLPHRWLIYSLPTVSSSCIHANSVSISLTSLSLLSFLYTIQIIISPTCTLVVPLTHYPTVQCKYFVHSCSSNTR